MSYVILEESVFLDYTSQNRSLIDLSTNTDNITTLTVIAPGDLAKFNDAPSPSVLLALRVFITIDFASRTSFNSSELLDFDPPQYWIGA